MESKNTTVLNLLGGAGIGKSTAASAIFALLKMHNVECDIVAEFAKDLVWEERHNILFDNQEYIFGEQYRRLWRVNKKIDVAIMECPLILGVTYGKYYNVMTETYANSVVEIINRFNNLNIVLKRKFNYNPNGRMHTEEEAKTIDNVIIKTLVDYNMPYVEVLCDIDGINNIVKMILNEEPKFKLTM